MTDQPKPRGRPRTKKPVAIATADFLKATEPTVPMIDGIPLSDWLPPTVNPEHVGVYKTQSRVKDAHGDEDVVNGFSWWGGEAWGPQFDNPKDAEDYGNAVRFQPGERQTFWHRGLVSEHPEHQI